MYAYGYGYGYKFGWAKGRARAWTPAKLFAGSTRGALYDADIDESVTIASGVVSQWKDLSGFGHHLTQATSFARPVRESINGHWWVAADGMDDNLRTEDNFDLSHTDKITIWAVMVRGAGNPGRIIVEMGNTYNHAGSFYMSTESGIRANMGGPGYMQKSLDTYTSLTERKVIVALMDRSTGEPPLIYDGGVLTDGSSAISGTLTGPYLGNKTLSLFARWNASSAVATTYGASKLSALGVIDRLLTEEEIAKLTAYYADRAGV